MFSRRSPLPGSVRSIPMGRSRPGLLFRSRPGLCPVPPTGRAMWLPRRPGSPRRGPPPAGRPPPRAPGRSGRSQRLYGLALAYLACEPGIASAAAARLTCCTVSRNACAASAACSARPLISTTACSSAAVRATRSRYLPFRCETRSASCQSRYAVPAALTDYPPPLALRQFRVSHWHDVPGRIAVHQPASALAGRCGQAVPQVTGTRSAQSMPRMPKFRIFRTAIATQAGLARAIPPPAHGSGRHVNDGLCALRRRRGRGMRGREWPGRRAAAEDCVRSSCRAHGAAGRVTPR